MFLRLMSIYLKGWEITRKNIFFLIGVFGGTYLFLSLLTYLSSLAIESVFVGLITSFLNIFFICLFCLGITKTIVKLSLTEEVSLKDMFSQWNQVFNIFISYFFIFIVLYVLHRFFMFFAVQTGLPDLFSLLWIAITFTIFILFFSFLNFIIVKHQMNTFNSYQYNFQVAKNNFVLISFFYFLFFIINIVGLMFFYIGLIITLPITNIAQSLLFNQLEE